MKTLEEQIREIIEGQKEITWDFHEEEGFINSGETTLEEVLSSKSCKRLAHEIASFIRSLLEEERNKILTSSIIYPKVEKCIKAQCADELEEALFTGHSTKYNNLVTRTENLIKKWRGK